MPEIELDAMQAWPLPRVLVVGGEQVVAEVVDADVMGLFDCRLVSDVEAARGLAAEADFEAVVLFAAAPGEAVDFELLAVLAERQQAAAIVVVSGRDDHGLAERAFALGAHSFLLSPLPSRQLAISIAGRLRQRSADRSKLDQLQHFQGRVERLMQRAPVPVFLKDLGGHYLFANPQAHRFAGLEEGALIGLTDRDFLSPESAAEAIETDRRIAASGEPEESERTLNVGGDERTYLSTKFPFVDEHGETIGVFGVAIDITDRKRSESQREAFAAEQRNLIYDLQRSRLETVDRLTRALVERDAVSGEHVSRMAVISSFLGELVGLEPEEVVLLRTAAPMHDVGKIGIRDEVLRKPGRLSEDERREMERHARIGFEILDDSHSEVLRLGAKIALTHHEHFDGSGYPRGLAGRQIPIAGRIAAVADVFDALLSDRPYRPGRSVDEVRQAIADGRGTHFDPRVADALLDNFEEALALRDGAAGGEAEPVGQSA